jgi:hypothetical protein
MDCQMETRKIGGGNVKSENIDTYFEDEAYKKMHGKPRLRLAEIQPIGNQRPFGRRINCASKKTLFPDSRFVSFFRFSRRSLFSFLGIHCIVYYLTRRGKGLFTE